MCRDPSRQFAQAAEEKASGLGDSMQLGRFDASSSAESRFGSCVREAPQHEPGLGSSSGRGH